MTWRRGLLIKLKNMGVSGRMFSYIKNLLTNTKIRVKIGTILSDLFDAENGVLQGSNISPLLFIIMIDDLVQNLQNVLTLLFADDSTIYKVGTNLKHTLATVQKAFDEIKSWCEAWGFKISPTKSCTVLFTHRTSDILATPLTLGGITIPIATEAKYLGVIFDNRLTWTPHINYIAGKARRRLNILRAVAGTTWGASKRTLLSIYKAVIRPILLYGSVAYASSYSCHTNKLQAIQYAALRICAGAMRGTSANDLLVHMGELPLPLHALENQLKIYTKAACLKTAAYPITINHWTNHYGRYRHQRDTIFNKCQDFLKSTDIGNILAPALPSAPPWRHLNITTDYSIQLLGDKHTTPELLKTAACEKIEQNKHTCRIFTDASLSGNKTGSLYMVSSHFAQFPYKWD